MFQVDFDTAELFLYDDIGPAWLGMVDDATVIDALAKLKGKHVTARINSNGGDMFMGVAIHNAFKRHPGGVDTVVDGLAASAASMIFAAGEKRLIAKNGSVMIHNASSLFYGNGQEMVKWGETLIKLSAGSVLESYTDVMNLDAEKIGALLDAETWFTAKEALDVGLATEIGNVVSTPVAVAVGRFRNTPESLLGPAKAGSRTRVETRIKLAKFK